MYRGIRRYTHWILIFGCLAIFVLTHQYHELFNKIGLKETNGDSEIQLMDHEDGKPIAALPGFSVCINRIPKSIIFSDVSPNNKSSFVSMTMGRQNTCPLRRWNSSHTLVFLHIGKNGGTSFYETLGPIVKRLGGHLFGGRHFDWSHIETLKHDLSYIETLKHLDVVVLLRDPVARAVSHFHFTKKKQIYQINVSLTEYIRDPQKMLEARDIWQDGQAAAMWLTGTHVANWVGIKPGQIPERESRFLDHKTICSKAVSRLKDTLWFGFLDDQERSFDMLQWQLGYPTCQGKSDLPRQTRHHMLILQQKTKLFSSP